MTFSSSFLDLASFEHVHLLPLASIWITGSPHHATKKLRLLFAVRPRNLFLFCVGKVTLALAKSSFIGGGQTMRFAPFRVSQSKLPVKFTFLKSAFPVWPSKWEHGKLAAWEVGMGSWYPPCTRRVAGKFRGGGRHRVP